MTEPKQAAITDAELDAVINRNERAYETVSALNHAHQEWLMSIPARPDHDPDLIIAASLRDVPRLVERVRELEARERYTRYYEKEFSGIVPTEGGKLRHLGDSCVIISEAVKEQSERVREQDAEIASLNREMNNMLAEATKQDAIIKELKGLITEVASSGVEFADERINYVTVQIDKNVWAALAKVESVDEGEK